MDLNKFLLPVHNIFRFLLIQRLNWDSILMQGLRFIFLAYLVTLVMTILLSFQGIVNFLDVHDSLCSFVYFSS